LNASSFYAIYSAKEYVEFEFSYWIPDGMRAKCMSVGHF